VTASEEHDPDRFATTLAKTANDLVPADAHADFSKAGYIEFTRAVAVYVGDLMSEAYRVTRRRHADHISPAFVKEAADRVSAPARQRLVTATGSLGGILIGSGISAIPTWLGTSTVQPLQAIGVLLLVGGGAALLVWALVTDR
jgi:hypothetical protein